MELQNNINLGSFGKYYHFPLLLQENVSVQKVIKLIKLFCLSGAITDFKYTHIKWLEINITTSLFNNGKNFGHYFVTGPHKTY